MLQKDYNKYLQTGGSIGILPLPPGAQCLLCDMLPLLIVANRLLEPD